MTEKLQGVTAYLAGAGTGKTYTICQEIRDMIVEGTDPERIIATTFTNKAAAELTNRVQEFVYDDESLSVEEKNGYARALEQAAIGTVHGIGHQFLKRYVLQLGMSPRLNVLDEDASKQRLDEFLTELDPDRWRRLNEKARPFEIDSPQDIIQQLIEQKRLNNIDDESFRSQMKASFERFHELLAPNGVDESLPKRNEFTDIARRAANGLRTCEHDYKYIDKAIAKLERAARRDRVTWTTVARFAGFQDGKDKITDITEPVRQFAGSVRRMPGLHEDLREFEQLLIQESIRIEGEYEAFKQERGLLDYIDLEVRFLEALRDPRVGEDVASSFDVLLVDEFQDSNPIQLAIFLRLHELIGRSFWVGDEKQSIYKFRDADLRLIKDAVGLLEEDDIRSLDTSYRAHQSLVDIFNDLFEPVFGEQARLRADDGSSRDISVERWCLDVGNNDEEIQVLTEGINQLLEEGMDPDEIAVLTRSNHKARSIGQGLDERGIPAVVEKPGLLSIRECAVAFAGLRVVADQGDTLALAEIHHLLSESNEDTPEWLLDRLGSLREIRESDDDQRSVYGWDESPYAQRLKSVDATLLSPKGVTETVIQKLNLPEVLARWGDVDRRSVNLDGLVEMAATYEELMQEEGRGATLRGFIEWAKQKHSDGEDYYPAPEGMNAVTVLTYHKAKGMQWPVVVMTQLKKIYPADMWEPRVSGGETDRGHPLRGRRLHYWPWPFGETRGRWGGKVSGTGLLEEAMESEAGQYEEKRERAEHERLLYVGMTRTAERLILTHRGAPDELPDESNYEWLAQLPVDEVLGTEFEESDRILDEYSTGLRIRHLTSDGVDMEKRPYEGGIGLEVPPVDLPSSGPRFRSPSQQEDAPVDVRVKAEPLPGDHPFEERVTTDDWDRLGLAVHTFLSGLPSLDVMDEAGRKQAAARCLRDHGVGGVVSADQLVIAGNRLLTWIDSQHSNSQWTTEVPVTALIEDSQWVGEIDVLLENRDGTYVIVDHKIKPVTEPQWEETGHEFAGQLYRYKQVIEGQGFNVSECWVHLPLGGGLVRLDFGSGS